MVKSSRSASADAQSCQDPGASNEADWAVALWAFAVTLGRDELPAVLHLLSDALADPGWQVAGVTPSTYDTFLNAIEQRFSSQTKEDFDDIARNQAGIQP